MQAKKADMFVLSPADADTDRWAMSLETNIGILHTAAADASEPMTRRCDFQSLSWTVRFTLEQGAITVFSEITNRGTKPVKLGKAVLLDGLPVELGVPGERMVVMPWQLGCHELHVYRLDDPQTPKFAKVKAQFYNQTAKRAMQAGFTTFQRCNTEVHFESEQGTLKRLKAFCDFAGWELLPGQTTTTETFWLQVGPDPYAQLEKWADKVASVSTRPIWQDAPLGYLGWSWTDCVNSQESYEKVTLENLDAINDKLAGFGFNYLWTSMSNFEGSLPGNWLKWNDRCIPSGRQAFHANVQKRGFHQGFWIGPFYLCSMLTDLMHHFHDAILKNPDGSDMVVCAQWNHGDAGLLPPSERPRLYALDPSHPKTLAFLKEVFETYRAWGVRYYMVDFLEAGAGNIHRFPYQDHYDHKLIAGAEVYTQCLREIKEAAGPDTYFLSSTGPSLHHAGILDGVRTGNDLGEGRAISPDSFFYPGSYVINDLSFWTAAQITLSNQAANYYTHRKLYLNDSGNVLTVDQPLPLSHARIHAAIHALGGGPSMLGDDIRHIAPERLALIKKTLPRPRACCKPADLFTAAYPDGARIFYRQVHTAWGEYYVAAFYNTTAQPQTMHADAETLGLEADAAYLGWDFWEERYVGEIRGKVTVHVAPESVTVLRLVKKTAGALLLGTDMHLLMGEMEIEKFSWNPQTLTCTVAAARPAGNRGSVFLYAGQNLYVKNIDGLHIGKDGHDQALIISIPMHFDAAARFERIIEFGPYQRPEAPSR